MAFLSIFRFPYVVAARVVPMTPETNRHLSAGQSESFCTMIYRCFGVLLQRVCRQRWAHRSDAPPASRKMERHKIWCNRSACSPVTKQWPDSDRVTNRHYVSRTRSKHHGPRLNLRRYFRTDLHHFFNRDHRSDPGRIHGPSGRNSGLR